MEEYETANIYGNKKTRKVCLKLYLLASNCCILCFRITEELCEPLQDQLKKLDNNIEKQKEEILIMRAKILKNHTRIKQTISQFV